MQSASGACFLAHDLLHLCRIAAMRAIERIGLIRAVMQVRALFARLQRALSAAGRSMFGVLMIALPFAPTQSQRR
jgi:hypothetical protein